MPYNRSMFSFIETKLFSRLVQQYLTDEEYRELQTTLIASPGAGPVIRGSGGLRKLRWQRRGQGKRGGYRVIYYPNPEKDLIWMLTIYPKNVADDVSLTVLRQIRKEIEDA